MVLVMHRRRSSKALKKQVKRYVIWLIIGSGRSAIAAATYKSSPLSPMKWG
jgi:hypothetical protein